MRWIRIVCGLAASLSLLVCAMALGCRMAGAQSPSTPAPSPIPPPRFAVVLDAAHGGDDAGGRLASGQLEKAATLAFSVRLRSLLGARGMTVATTRESDVTVEAAQRATIANRAKAAACLSIHATESGSGIHLFTSSLTPTQPTQFVAWKTAQSAWITRSLALSGAINSALQHDSFSVTLSRTALSAVDNMTCPALAIEIAPARGPDGKVTAEPEDPDYQARIANSLAAALLEWRMEPHQP
jgi:N-acetylmuramoyl-L-alanine amidase